MLEHAKDPHNFGKIDNPTLESDDSNPSCGDSIKMYFIIENGVVKEVKFEGTGCAVSQASASILTEYIIGKKQEKLKEFSETDFFKLLGFDLSPSRKKCALVSFNTLKKALDKLE
jgi:nitrogen fixation NifU-like protein